MTLKIAVFAPMPRPSVKTASAANPLCFNSVRAPYRRSALSSSSQREPVMVSEGMSIVS